MLVPTSTTILLAPFGHHMSHVSIGIIVQSEQLDEGPICVEARSIYHVSKASGLLLAIKESEHWPAVLHSSYSDACLGNMQSFLSIYPAALVRTSL